MLSVTVFRRMPGPIAGMIGVRHRRSREITDT